MLLLTTSCKQEEETNAEVRVAVSASADAGEAAAATGGEVKIWKGAAAIHREYQVNDIQSVITADQMERSVLEYWLNPAAERKFPIAIWKIKQLLGKSPTGEIALKVTNIADSAKVDVECIAYNSRTEAKLSAPKGERIDYFVIEKKYFTGPILLSSGKELEGVNHYSDSDPANHIIWARIGKDIHNNYSAFLAISECFTLRPDGRRGNGASSGFRIPAP